MPITLADLQQKVALFTQERGWEMAHDGKNLAMSIAIEAAELMEHFQWGERAEYAADLITPEQKTEIGLEAADVLIYLLSFCHVLKIDLAAMTLDKLQINAGRWPAIESPEA